MINKHWNSSDEKEHFPSNMEWWCVVAFLNSIDNNEKWSLKGSFAEWFDSRKIGSILKTTLINLKNKKYYTYTSQDDYKKLVISQNIFSISYDDSYLNGIYPKYSIFFNDKQNNIQINLNYQAVTNPRWISQNVTNGWLPMGFGSYRYGFIPKSKISGTIDFDGKKHYVSGIGYYEHVWGNIWYDNPLSNLSNIRKTITIYLKLAKKWLNHNKIKIPKKIIFSSENNPFGYDWAWILINNGWVIYFGNILFWLNQGPVFGTLILINDHNKFIEFFNINFKYNKIEYSKIHDFFYPTEIELNAKRDNIKLNLLLKTNMKSREYVSYFDRDKFWKCFVICEAPGIVNGNYFDGEKNHNIEGICKIESQKQISKFGHNSLKIEIKKPPKEFGISIDFKSHFYKKHIFNEIQLIPKPKIIFSIRKIDDLKINE